MSDENKTKVGAGAGYGPATVNGYTIDPSSAGYAALVSAAQAMNAIADFTSSAACGPVKGFQGAWNAAGGTPSLTVDGGYGQDTANANAAVAQLEGGNVPAGLTGGWPNCGGGGRGGGGQPQPGPGPIQPSGGGGMSKGLKVFLWIVVAAGVLAGTWALGRYLWRKFGGAMGAAEGKKKKRKKSSSR